LQRFSPNRDPHDERFGPWYTSLPLAWLWDRWPTDKGKQRSGPAHEVLLFIDLMEEYGGIIRGLFASPE
jgi:hypothetical protein